MANKKVISKYGVGTYWMHRRDKFIIEIVKIKPFSIREFRVIVGTANKAAALRLRLMPHYSVDTLRTIYEPINPKAVKVLYGKSNVNK